MLLGIDVSDFQGTVDWASVAKTHQFAFCKATEGTGFVAHTFNQNWQGIKAAGLVRGAYHFARPDDNSPEDEANHFLSTVGALEAGDLLVLDLETGSGDKSGWTSTFLKTVADQTGFLPLLYSGRGFLTELNCLNNDNLAQHGLWLAAFQSLVPSTPPSWPVLAFWQHTDRASVPGVPSEVDEDFFFGDADALLKYGKPGAVTSTPPPQVQPAPVPGDYLARRGDSLESIAAQIDVPLATLQALNPQITDTSALDVGDIVHLPPFAKTSGLTPPDPSAGSPATTNKTYTVVSGDTMTAIASKLGVGLLTLERLNPQISDPNVIEVGEVLNAPG